jgi:hypothetical protein
MLNKRDKAAMQLAIDTLLADASDPGRQEQVRDFLDHPRRWGKTWEETGSFCSFCCQMDNLSLMPWELPPCCSDGVGDEAHAVLYRQLKAAGVSIYHPDPASALLGEAEKVST